jgi:hypothetical protein
MVWNGFDGPGRLEWGWVATEHEARFHRTDLEIQVGNIIYRESKETGYLQLLVLFPN